MANQYTSKFPERFWAKVQKANPDDCWLWTASVDECGYGTFGYQGRTWRAHRVSYLIHYGKFDFSLKVLHTCDTPACVNPRHLGLGTQGDNIRDMTAKNRHGNQGPIIDYDGWLIDRPAKSVDDKCRRGHTFSKENTRLKNNKSHIVRVCRQCQYNSASRDWVSYKVKSFVRGIEGRREVIEGVVSKIKNNHNKCWYCPGPFECLDHEIPKIKGGAMSVDNINPSCNNCNQARKGLING